AMLPGKKYTPEDLLQIAVKRAWIVIVTVVLCGAAAVLVSKRLPNQFRSETLIMVIPPRISDNYVKAAVTTKIEDRLSTLEDHIRNRTRPARDVPGPDHNYN